MLSALALAAIPTLQALLDNQQDSLGDTAAASVRAPWQDTMTPALMNSSRSTRGTTRITA